MYDISLSARTGAETLDIERTPLFIAEGIFAAEIVERCRELGVLADALCLSRGPVHDVPPPASCGICGRAASPCRSCCAAAGA